MKLLFFGSLAETIGREIELPVEPGTLVAQVREQLIARHPAAASQLEPTAARACLDDVVVSDETPVPGGAELAFFPPLSGG